MKPAWAVLARMVCKCFTVRGYEHMEQARAQGKGVVLVGMHFSPFELGARIFGMLNPGIGAYRPNNNVVGLASDARASVRNKPCWTVMI